MKNNRIAYKIYMTLSSDERKKLSNEHQIEEIDNMENMSWLNRFGKFYGSFWNWLWMTKFKKKYKDGAFDKLLGKEK
tara:strand:- start:1110 stop:1340 length:231 start_codon:yes stop_codon:yes gene_type:complete